MQPKTAQALVVCWMPLVNICLLYTSYQDDNTPQSLQLSKNKATLKIGASGLELMKSQNGSDLESEVISLFTDGSLTRLVDVYKRQMQHWN